MSDLPNLPKYHIIFKIGNSIYRESYKFYFGYLNRRDDIIERGMGPEKVTEMNSLILDDLGLIESGDSYRLENGKIVHEDIKRI
jgi:hypothetical protein